MRISGADLRHILEFCPTIEELYVTASDARPMRSNNPSIPGRSVINSIRSFEISAFYDFRPRFPSNAPA